jgi:hypothetical protein
MTVVKGIADQFGAQVRRHRPADHPSTPDIQHDREEQETGRGRDVGDVGGPELIGRGSGELPLHQAGRRPRQLIALGRPELLASMEGSCNPVRVDERAGRHHQEGPCAALIDTTSRTEH